MRLLKQILPLIILLSITVNTDAQTSKEKEINQKLNTEPIQSQIDVLISKSNRYKEYKVIKLEYLNQLKSNIIDSLNAVKSKLKNSQNNIASQQNEITSLKAELQQAKENLASTEKEKDSVRFIGIQLNKSSYKNIVLTIIGALLAFLGLFIYKFKNSNSITVQAKNDLLEIQEEFEQHRKSALKREQKIMRKLQDELNKQKL